MSFWGKVGKASITVGKVGFSIGKGLAKEMVKQTNDYKNAKNKSDDDWENRK